MYRINSRNEPSTGTAVISVCIVIIINLSFSFGTSAAAIIEKQKNTNFSELPSVSAVLHRYSNKTPHIIREARVSISPMGLRVTDLTNKSEILKNFTSDQVWIIDQRYKTQHQLDVHAIQNEFPELLSHITGPQTRSNILGKKPCTALHKSFTGEKVWRGQIVESWICREISGIFVSEQLLSKRYGIVVQVRHPDGTVEELHNISEREFDKDAFKINDKLTKVSLKEIFERSKRLERYSGIRLDR